MEIVIIVFVVNGSVKSTPIDRNKYRLEANVSLSLMSLRGYILPRELGCSRKMLQ